MTVSAKWNAPSISTFSKNIYSFIINLTDKEYKFFLLQNIAMKHFVNHLSTILSLKKLFF